MQVLGEKFFTSQALKGYAERRNIDVYFDKETQEISFHFVEISDAQTEDDFVWYKFDEEKSSLFYGGNYQVDGLEDLPHWIENVSTLKELINYISKDGK